MKRFTVFTSILSVSLVALWAFFQVAPAPVTRYDNSPIRVYDSTGAMLEAIDAKSGDEQIAPVYDSTDAMLEAINPNAANVRTAPVYDSTGAMLDAINPNKKVTTHSIYDATGAMLDAINP
jgi:hypothetical protein